MARDSIQIKGLCNDFISCSALYECSLRHYTCSEKVIYFQEYIVRWPFHAQRFTNVHPSLLSVVIWSRERDFLKGNMWKDFSGFHLNPNEIQSFPQTQLKLMISPNPIEIKDFPQTYLKFLVSPKPN